jgi:uncharacterized protein YukE
MDVGTDRAKLHDKLKELRVRWQQVQQDWDDPVRREFEETHMAALEARVQTALRAMDQLATALRQARHECS